MRNALNSATVVTKGREGDSYFLEFKVLSTAAQGHLWTETERSGETKRRGGGEGGGRERDELDISSFRLNVRSTVQGPFRTRKRESVLMPMQSSSSYG